MPNTLRIKANETEHEVETKPITVICHSGDVNLKPLSEDVLEITPTETVATADNLSEPEWALLKTIPVFQKAWNCVFPDIQPPATLKGEGLGYRHIVGMIIMLAKAATMNKRPYVRFPETYLHPKAQCGLADLFIVFMRGDR